MLSWIVNNLATILITLVLVAVVAVIVIELWRNHRKGKFTCGCNCAHCAMAGSCHKK